jgi:hypothetical protein
MAGQVPVGTLCRIDDAIVSWADPCTDVMIDMFVSQEPDEDLYYAIVLQHDEDPGRARRFTRCLAIGFETGSDNTFWMIGSQPLKPI